MAGLWSVVLNESTSVTNLVTNPSGETDATGYAGITATVAASTAKSRWGRQSIITTPTTAVGDGLYYDALSLTSGTTYTMAFNVWGVDGIPYLCYFADTAGNAQSAAGTSITGNGNWQRISHSYSATATASFRFYVTKNNSDSVGAFYVDGVGVYALDHDPGHVDGDQEDCSWNGTAHASTATRKAGSRADGQVVNFDSYDFFLTEWPGAGMEEVDVQTQPLGPLPGSQYAGEKALERTFSLVGDVTGSSLADLHYNRKSLIDALKSDRVRDNQPVILQYSGANSNRPVRIKARYTGGLTLQKPNGFTERVALRFLAEDPYWYEYGEEAATLTLYGSDSDANYAIKRVNGVWSALNSAIDGNVYAFAVGPNKRLYIGGTFNTVTGTTDGEGVAYFSSIESTAPVAMTTGLSENGTGDALEFAPNGDLYVGGYFTSAGDVANTGSIARWDGSTWYPLSTGIPTTTDLYDVDALEYGQDGYLYIGGKFLNVGDANGDGIVRWDGTAFSSMGTGASGASLSFQQVYALKYGPDNNLYAGGNFDSMGGVANTAGIARWDGSAWYALGAATGLASTDSVDAIEFDKAGNMYVGGSFSAIGGVTAANIAKWNGVSFEPLGSGTNGAVSTIVFADDGLMYVTGSFSAAGGLTLADGAAVWNGSSWAHIPANLPGGAPFYILPVGKDLLIAHGAAVAGTAVFSALNTITNSGTAPAYPRVVFKRTDATASDSGTIEYLENLNTGARIWFNYSLQCGETLTVDFDPQNRSITSSHFGSVIGRAILRNSDFAKFNLLPGENDVSVFVNLTGAAAATGYAVWKIAHHSQDGSST